MYTVTTVLKHAEQDVFSEGCLPESSFMTGFDLNIKAETFEGLIQELKIYLGEYFQIDPMGEDENRIDFQRMENEQGAEPSETEINNWKQGKEKLWLVNYTVYVYEETPADLSMYHSLQPA